MKFSIGDRIILRESGEEGVVIAYINDQMVEVEVSGLSFPVYMQDIDHPYLKWFTEKTKAKRKGTPPEQLPVEKTKDKMPKLAKGIYLSFLPVFKPDVFEDIVDHIKIYLQNELPQSIYYKYEVTNKHKESLFKLEGKLHGFGHIYLHTLPFDVMNEQPRFAYELTDADSPKHNIVSDTLRMKPQKLFEHISEVLKNNQPVFSYLCTEGFAARPDKKAEDSFWEVSRKPVSQSKPAKDWRASLPRFELDLHIENLISNTNGMSNGEILHIQLEALQAHLNVVIANKQVHTIIIHGLGKGVLKDEVHKILKQIPEVARFSNDWKARYGFGATEVWFQY